MSEAVAGEKGRVLPTTTSRQGSDRDFDEDPMTREQDLDALETEQSQVDESQVDVAENEEEVSESFPNRHDIALQSTFELRPIPKAVILPQRRPRDRGRGFITAYAPDLGEYSGISQKTFIDFITNWDKAAKASPVFDVINIACFAVGMIQDPVEFSYQSP